MHLSRNLKASAAAYPQPAFAIAYPHIRNRNYFNNLQVQVHHCERNVAFLQLH
jgi:hypothetical protein